MGKEGLCFPYRLSTTALISTNMVRHQEPNINHNYMKINRFIRLDKALYLNYYPVVLYVRRNSESPKYVAIDEGIAYILTYSGLLSVNPSHQEPSLQIIVHKGPWYRYAPNSLVKQGDSFVIGMHSGVTVVKSNVYGTSEIKFYGK